MKGTVITKALTMLKYAERMGRPIHLSVTFTKLVSHLPTLDHAVPITAMDACAVEMGSLTSPCVMLEHATFELTTLESVSQKSK